MSDQPPPNIDSSAGGLAAGDRTGDSTGRDPTGGKTASATELPPPLERDPFWNYSDLALFLVMAIPSMFAGSLVAHQIVKAAVALFHIHARIPAIEPLAEQLGGDAILFAVLALILRLQYDRPLWRSLGWRPPGIPFLPVVISGLLCALSVALLGSLIHLPTTTNPIVELMKNRASAILMACFGVTIAPLTEELVFRGFLQPLLVRSLGAVPGILLAAIPFGLLHYHEYGNSWRHAVLIGLAGAAFGWMRHRTGSTQASTLMHASYNALIFFAVL
ncbi:MAG TPA: type II CAAX endopeptidase family protein [Bryobacteraceae bacterium]|jgi:membrane protease YdiL (CAAX protease family)|nr:type II CAAX endopeptidase family protein [Bryobacteraceae bacterium]